MLTGASGQLGTEIRNSLQNKSTELGDLPEIFSGAEVVCADIDTVDITDSSSLESLFASNRFDAVINCAAYTSVDECEHNIEKAFKINSYAVSDLARLASRYDCKFVHISTDYVFDGNFRSVPYEVDDEPNPITIYGKSKLCGEKAALSECSRSFVIRTAWLYGYSGNNFVKTILNAAKQNRSLNVVDDQIGNPTNANDLTHHIFKILSTDDYGIYHCSGNDICSWFDFAAETVRLSGLSCEVVPCKSRDFVRAARRPAYSALSNRKLDEAVGDEMRPYKQALKSYLESKSVAELPRNSGIR